MPVSEDLGGYLSLLASYAVAATSPDGLRGKPDSYNILSWLSEEEMAVATAALDA